MIAANRNRLSIVAGVALAAAFAALTPADLLFAQANPSGSAGGWTSLFDGKTLTGWRGYRQPDATGTRWVAADGMLCVNPKVATTGRDIVTVATFREFELRWEWRVAEGANGGLKYFVLEDQTSAIGHEYQLMDDLRAAAATGKHSTASFYDVLPPGANRPLRPAGQFNESRIIVAGLKIEHWLNGAKVLEYELDSAPVRAGIAESKFAKIERFGKPHQAHILLQDHNDPVCFRNIMIRPGATASR